VHEVEVFVGLPAVVVLLALLARPLRVPHAVVLVTGGMTVGALPVAPPVWLDPYPHRGELSGDALRALVRDLDLQEARLR
jgi:hypothetical protein